MSIIQGMRKPGTMQDKIQRPLCGVRGRGVMLAASLALVACGGGAPAGGSSGTEGPPVYGATGPPDYFAMGPTAPFTTAYRGLRKVELYYNAHAPMVYQEDVGSDGQGKFSVETLDVLISSNPDTSLFLLLQTQRQALIYRHRDFRIRDLGLFLANYDYVVAPAPTTVAGVTCDRVQVQARVAAQSRFEVDIDPTTGLVMAWEEHDLATGNLEARIAFETYVPNGDLSDMALMDRVFQTSTYGVDTNEFRDALGFLPLIPQLQPGVGYQLVPQAEVLVVNGENWAKLYLTDGMGTCIFMDSMLANGGGASADLSEKKDEVAVMQIGSWSSLRGSVRGHSVIMAGRVSQLDLATVLDSSLR
jgi:hypothetical protein